MCILFVALQTHPKFPLIICANRDEFHHRPTEPAHLWPTENPILAGKDLQAGGTWLGVNQQGKVAGLTNIRAPELNQIDMQSRGELVLKALSEQGINQDWLQRYSQFYNPFNLLFGDELQLQCFDSRKKQLTHLSAGFHAISNGALDEIWPKMARGTQAIEQHINSHSTPDVDALLNIMTDKTQAPDSELPTTGVSVEWERHLSSIYIQHQEYGTRSTSIIMKDQQGKLYFTEVRYDGKGRNLGRDEFVIEPKSE
ncbi:NRDE family protein [Shewanella fidelis]|uniref:NRDE family protein n=1 Tax=Shewanella fidelis TaxID=173509 RepID=A0AAW8NRD1_9GAMM|nr:NRDE family protein [Shewanella fidelis]MDR8525764.1 NRDE family protein [Shewanella fidelis]MDW4812727.1 NRDE family protein [Shewanella fidelis]MDW4816475.1 NRDE family protein [Shewanella fidelis]MDW4820361.1 NRDE family protein [Shewanella fidelis]MDW4825191.1 NRDE family protein [Shewanella fidelis]